jgi:protein-tyrosine phosphatase
MSAMKDIFWIRGNPPAALAIVLCPPGGRGLHDELLTMKIAGIETLVSLLEEDEAHRLGLAQEGRLAEQIGLQFLSHPIPDTYAPPNRTSFRAFAAGLADRLRDGEAVGIHCRGSIGRATVAAACALIHLGWSPKAALAAITAARGQAVPDTQEQEDWILRYKPLP